MVQQHLEKRKTGCFLNTFFMKITGRTMGSQQIVFSPIWPSPLSGAVVWVHCLSIDTYHLEQGLKVLCGQLDNLESKVSIWVVGRTVNDFMSRPMISLTTVGLSLVSKIIEGAKIALLEWAFIINSDNAPFRTFEIKKNILGMKRDLPGTSLERFIRPGLRRTQKKYREDGNSYGVRISRETCWNILMSLYFGLYCDGISATYAPQNVSDRTGNSDTDNYPVT